MALSSAYEVCLQASFNGGDMPENLMDTLNSAEEDLTIVQAYLDYDVEDKRIDAGWSHPCVLRALAHFQGINLYIWQEANNSLIPHPYYPEYIIGDDNPTKDLLFVNNNHFEHLEVINTKDVGENMPTKKPSL